MSDDEIINESDMDSRNSSFHHDRKDSLSKSNDQEAESYNISP